MNIELTPDEKKLLNFLVKKEIETFEKDETAASKSPALLATEEKYDIFLDKLKKKLE